MAAKAVAYLISGGDNTITDADGDGYLVIETSSGYTLLTNNFIQKVTDGLYVDCFAIQYQWNGTNGSDLTITLADNHTTTVNADGVINSTDTTYYDSTATFGDYELAKCA